jgi:DNA invertase Pin-like site-specific DNA recombinase
LGYSEFVDELPSLDELESGDIVVVESLGDVFSNVDDFLLKIELLKSNWVELHIVDFESVNLDGNITWGSLSGVIPSLIKQLENWKSGEISKRNKKVKLIQREKSVYLGGRKEKGFTVKKIGRKQVQVVDEQEKMMLERIFKWKLERDDEFDQTGKNDKITIRFIHNRLRSEFSNMDWVKEITDSKGKKRRVEKFGLTTLYRLLDDNYHNNVIKRLERMDSFL